MGMDRWRSGSVALALGMAVLSVDAAAEAAVLTGDTWSVTGTDQAGTTWGGSSLMFTAQTLQGDGSFQVEGYFDWVGSGGQSGRELFNGTYFSFQEINLFGYQLVNPNGIALAIYTGTVAQDGNTISGAWSGPNVVAGDFEATRVAAVIPLPAGLPLIATALAAFAVAARRRGR